MFRSLFMDEMLDVSGHGCLNESASLLCAWATNSPAVMPLMHRTSRVMCAWSA